MAIVLDGTNGITNVDGSAAAPAFKNQDANTGLSGSADQIVVSTGGSERFRVASAGQLGIAGANYGTSGQVLKSGGASAAPSWGDGGVTEDAQDNIQIGTNAGADFSGTSAEFNVLIGESAGKNITTGDKNICLGTNAGRSILDVSSNIAIGHNCGYRSGNNWTGDKNVWIGDNIGSTRNVWGYRNTFIGYEAGLEIEKGYDNVFLGYQAGRKIYDGHGNVGIGTGAFAHASTSDVTGDHNVIVGYYSGVAITTGHINTCIGANTGYDITTGNENCCLGRYAGTQWSPSGSITTGEYNVVIGSNNVQNFYCADTSISSSDERDKTDFEEWTHGLDWINKLKPITYRWDKRSWYLSEGEEGDVTKVTRDGSKKRPRLHLGFKAQDVLAVEQADGYASKKDDMLLVNLNEDDTSYGMKYERLVVVLTKAVQELSAEVNTLKTKVAALEAA